MSVLRRHRLLAACVLIGVVASVAVLFMRHRLESSSRTVTVTLDAESWGLLAEREGQANDGFWRRLREQGANGVALYDQTLRRLADENRVRVFDGATLAELLRARAVPPELAGVPPSRVDRRAVYILYQEEDVGRLLRGGFDTALGEGRARRLPAGQRALEVTGRLSDLEETGLGFLAADVRAWEARGFHVVLRPRNLRGADAARLRARIASYRELGPGRTFIPELTDFLGFERLLKEAAGAFREIDGRYGRIEVLAQQRRIRGEESMTLLMRPSVVRVFGFAPEALDRFQPPDAVDRFVRAARERNLRILYVRPFLNLTAGIDPVASNVAYVRSITTRVRDAGFMIGPAAPLPPISVPRPIHAAVLLGAAASFCLVAALIADLAGWRPHPATWPAAAVGVALLGLAASSIGFDGWVRKGLALAAAIAFPTLALYFGVPAPGGAAGKRVSSRRVSTGWATLFAVGRLSQISAVSLLGGLVVGAVLADWRFMLAFDQFPGVKLAAVLPVLVFAAMWILRWERALPATERRGLIARAWASLGRPLLWRHAVLALSIAGVVLLLLVRSGNTSLPLVGIEERLRGFVEDAFVARPRTKEYLFGHPLLLLALAAAALRLPNLAFPLALVGSVGQTGLLNSFCHIHTPVLYALWRTGNALALGTAIGVGAVVVLAALWHRWGAWIIGAAARSGVTSGLAR
ncbi:MAG: hypothetical protein FJX78_02355 [Armatimonadetes bacterium]|nr:hypothetical protein [Armatimonadota bacterium]